MDTETLRTLIRAAVLAAPLVAPLSACGGNAPPPAPPVVNLTPQATPEPDSNVSATTETQTQTETHARTDGTMEPDEFDRQWTQSLGGGGPEPEQPQIMIMEGRPLMASHGPVRAALRSGTGWSHTDVVEAHPRVAARWLDAALAEHASVASFARAVIELSALGAPGHLLEGHLAASLDEMRHARLSFGLAARFGAQNRVPGPMPTPTLREASFRRLAVDTFVEGCVNETISALVATRAAAGCQDPEVRETLQTLADDEARHAALAWQTVRWALDAEPEPVRAGLAEAELPWPEGGHREPTLLAYGLLDAFEMNRATRDAVSRVIGPLRDELLLG